MRRGVGLAAALALGASACGSDKPFVPSSFPATTRAAATTASAPGASTAPRTVVSAGASATPTPTTPAPAAAVRLTILTPVAGGVYTGALPVEYTIAGFRLGMSLRVFIGDVGGYSSPVPLASANGQVFVDDKALSGRRDLVFVVVGPDQAPLPGAGTRVTVPGVVIEGGR